MKKHFGRQAGQAHKMRLCPATPTTSERTLLRSDFSLQKNQSHAPSFLLFRKKARSARLFACKRTHNGSQSLPPFCEMRLRRKYLYGSALPKKQYQPLGWCCFFIYISKNVFIFSLISGASSYTACP